MPLNPRAVLMILRLQLGLQDDNEALRGRLATKTSELFDVRDDWRTPSASSRATPCIYIYMVMYCRYFFKMVSLKWCFFSRFGAQVRRQLDRALEMLSEQVLMLNI